jgi:bifunctional non-homologous end joining protein LigD
VTYDQTKGLSRSLAQRLEREHPDRVTSNMSKAVRKGKVFVDWSQNDEHKTTIAVYSLRAREHPTVSTPVKWEEVEHMLKKKDPSLLVFEAGQVLKRVEKMGDLFEPVLKLRQTLPKLTANVGAGVPAPVASEGRGSSSVKKGLKIAAQAGSGKKAVKSSKKAPGKKTGKK